MSAQIKLNLLVLGTILGSFSGYLEWGGGNSAFMLEGEIEVIQQLMKSPKNAIHPFTILPLIGQLLLVLVLIRSKWMKWFLYIGILGIGTLYSFILIIGLMSLNLKIVASVIPFFVMAIWTIRLYRKLQVS